LGKASKTTFLVQNVEKSHIFGKKRKKGDEEGIMGNNRGWKHHKKGYLLL